MEIDGYSDDQLAAMPEMWKLGKPVDVGAFLDRPDIPEEAKKRIREAGKTARVRTKAEAEAYRNMQAQVLIEVAKLDRRQWKP